QLQNSIKMLLPKFVQAEITLRPSKRSLTRFMWNPLVVIAAIISASLVGVIALPEWKELIGWLCLMGVIPTLWFLTVRIIDRFTGGIGITKECITVKYSKGFSFHTVVIPLQKIAMVRSVQSVFQIKNKSCDLYIYSYSESIKQHRIRNISTENAKAIIKAI
ncbi:MAG: PH domain-containing protein, partial [Oscillospiraceae bacterium]